MAKTSGENGLKSSLFPQIDLEGNKNITLKTKFPKSKGIWNSDGFSASQA